MTQPASRRTANLLAAPANLPMLLAPSRAAAVSEPGLWRWGGYAELQGLVSGRPLLAVGSLAEWLDSSSLEQTRGLRRGQIEHRLAGEGTAARSALDGAEAA